MSKCRFCLYWADIDGDRWIDDTEKDHDPYKDFRKCGKIKHLYYCKEWNAEYTGEQIIDENQTNLAFVEDASGYYAALLTAPDFGCVHFQKRPL